MSWTRIEPERVPDSETVSFRIRTTPALFEAWEQARPGRLNRRFVALGVGEMVGEVKTSPQWFSHAWLSEELRPYEGGDVDELVASAALGPRPFAFDVGAPVWATVDTKWKRAGVFLGEGDDPPWTAEIADLQTRVNSPPVTVPDPATLEPGLAPFRRVWVRENPLELWGSGIYGHGQALHSFTCSEDSRSVRLSAQVGVTPEFLRAKADAAARGITFAVPAIAYFWSVCARLSEPLADRDVLIGGDERWRDVQRSVEHGHH
jgi:hypothetical protein